MARTRSENNKFNEQRMEIESLRSQLAASEDRNGFLMADLGGAVAAVQSGATKAALQQEEVQTNDAEVARLTAEVRRLILGIQQIQIRIKPIANLPTGKRILSITRVLLGFALDQTMLTKGRSGR